MGSVLTRSGGKGGGGMAWVAKGKVKIFRSGLWATVGGGKGKHLKKRGWRKHGEERKREL
jgi:hypothetical protein